MEQSVYSEYRFELNRVISRSHVKGLERSEARSRTLQSQNRARSRLNLPLQWPLQRIFCRSVFTSLEIIGRIHGHWNRGSKVRGYHYKIQESAKMCAPILKRYQLQAGFAPDLPLGALTLDSGPPLPYLTIPYLQGRCHQRWQPALRTPGGPNALPR